MSFFGPLLPLFWISDDVSSRFHYFFVEVNAMYIPQDPPLVLHVPTSWWPAAQPVTSPYASAEVRVGNKLIQSAFAMQGKEAIRNGLVMNTKGLLPEYLFLCSDKATLKAGALHYTLK